MEISFGGSRGGISKVKGPAVLVPGGSCLSGCFLSESPLLAKKETPLQKRDLSLLTGQQS